MVQRPTSITIIAWILIAFGGFGLLAIMMEFTSARARESMAPSPVPIPVQILVSVVAVAIVMVTAIGILDGRNWARMLYVGLTGAGFVSELIKSPTKMSIIPGPAFFLIVVFFLFRPAANAFFARSTASDNTSHLEP